MKIARYWARGVADAHQPDGQTLRIACWRWSEHSQAEAQQRADEAARDAAKRVAAGGALLRGYGYTDRPPREEIVKEIQDRDGQTLATVTRNSYGSLILNTRQLMFIDVDLPAEQLGAGLMRGFKRLWGRHEPDRTVLLRERLANTASLHSAYTTRLYQTHAGFRCAIVNQPIPPAGSESESLFAAFEADPLYVRLCTSQQSYRVRLTPKFWRCGASRPPHRYPWESAAQQQQYREWEAAYEQRCAAYATCRFLQQFGRQPIAAEFEVLIQLHDHMTRAEAPHALPLA
jgi:hypothetical protein